MRVIYLIIFDRFFVINLCGLIYYAETTSWLSLFTCYGVKLKEWPASLVRGTKGFKKVFDSQMKSKLKETLKRSVSTATILYCNCFHYGKQLFSILMIFYFSRHCVTVGFIFCGIFIINRSWFRLLFATYRLYVIRSLANKPQTGNSLKTWAIGETKNNFLSRQSAIFNRAI